MHVNDILLRHDLQAIAERLYRNVDWSGGPLSCWPWLGDASEKGYGQARIGGGRSRSEIATHRLSYVLANGPLPDEIDGKPTWVLHHCDNPPCCNPAHLFLGNYRVNVDDMLAKDRQARGEDSGRSKLTESDVRYILASYENAPALAAKFEVSEATIGSVRLRKTWRHVAGVPVKPRIPHGEKAPTAKITELQAIAILADPRTHAAIAAEYGLSRRHVGFMKEGRVWKHLHRSAAE